MPKRPEQTIEQPAEQASEAPIPLPLIFSRSSLFTASRNELDLTFNKKPIYASGKWTVFYTGHLLRQQELDVWSTCLRLARKNQIKAGERLIISRSQFLHEMGIARSGREAKDLVTKLERLRTAMLTVEGPIRVTRANLLAVFDEENAGDISTRDRIIISFDPLFEPLLENHVSESYVSTSLSLKQVLAKWLYRYATTHEGEFNVGIEKLRDWSGNSEDFEFFDPTTRQIVSRKAMTLSDFRRALKNAIQEVKETASDEFAELKLERKAGEAGEGQLVVKLSGRPRVLIKKEKTAHQRGWGVSL